MNINFRQPKYVLPIIALPFICLFFYVFHAGAAKDKKTVKPAAGLNGTVADVSSDVKKRRLEGKLDAYRDRYKDADGASAVIPIPADTAVSRKYGMNVGQQQKRQLDSIDSIMKRRFSVNALKKPHDNTQAAMMRDQRLADALNKLSVQQKRPVAVAESSLPVSQDPMDIFKKQMAYMDSVRKMSDPNWQKQQQEARLKAEAKKAGDSVLPVAKSDRSSLDFNTVEPAQDKQFITAVIDENVTGYAGSRIRLRLLEPVTAGKVTVPKDTYLYALISGFSGQRVTLSITTIMYNGQLLPVRLEVYDQDGLPGLYVPDSQFRDFTKDLGTSTMQGVSIDNGSASGSAFLMSAAGKVFESASGAVASAIRKNKAKIKYNSYIYLIDTKNPNP